MRIAFITNNYTPYAAGVVKSIDAIVQQLQKMGHEIIIIAPQFFKYHDDPSYVKRIPSLLRFKYKRKHMAAPWCAKHYLKKYLQEFNPDIVHVQHPFLLGAMGARIAREIAVPVLFTYHTVYEDYVHYVPLPEWLVKPIATATVLSFCKSVDRVITPSKGIQEYLRGKEITHTTVIPSPLRKLFCNVPFVEKALAAPYQLMCVSRFAKEKNISVLFDVLSKLPYNYHLTLVGYGDLEEELRKEAQRFGDRVQFIIDPSDQQMLSAYKQAHLFVFPSHTDTQGLVLAESMAMNTPVIALDGMGQRDIIEQGINGFIVKDSEQMAQRIMSIVQDPFAYQKLQKSAWQTAAQYAPARIVDCLLDLYRKAL